MAHITSARLRMAERVSRRVASKFRRECGVMARAQVKPTLPRAEAEAFKAAMTKDILSQLAESYPDDGFTHEGEVLKKPEGKGLMWHINALGGFENFLRGQAGFYQLYVVTDKGVPVEATAYDPIQDTISLSVKGNGAIGLETRLRVSGLKTLEDGLLYLSNVPADKTDVLFKTNAEVRISGSFLEDILAVCSGQAEAMYCGNMPHTEALFAALMVTESGGKASKPEGGKPFKAGNIKCFKELTDHVG